jgi:hypothetical protein
MPHVPAAFDPRNVFGHDGRMNDFSPWIRPTLLGPFVSCFGLVTLAHFTLGEQVLFNGHRFDNWLLSMMITGFFAAGMVVNLILADVALLKSKIRRLPTGFRGWVSSMVAPLGVFFVWNTFGMGDGDSVLELVVRIVAPMIAVAYLSRLVLGARP